jgi:hypothetical protein
VGRGSVTTLTLCLSLGACQILSGLEDLDVVRATATGATGGGGGEGGSGGSAGSADCPEGFLDANRDRASDGCELRAPIPTEGLVLWLHGDAGVELVQPDEVTHWLDQSDKRHDFVPTTPDRRPSFEARALQGHGVIRFDETPLELDEFSLESGFQNGLTFAGVILRDDVPGVEWDPFFDMQSPTVETIHLLRSGGGNAFDFGYPQTGGSAVTAVDSYLPSEPHVVVVVDDAGTLTFRVDDVAVPLASNQLGTIPESTTFEVLIGGSFGATRQKYHHGFIAEMILYDRPLSTRAVDQIEGYLLAKYVQ